MVFIIKDFRTIVFIFIVISTTFRPICLLAFFRCLSNSGTYTELRTTSFIESMGVACSDSVSQNRVQMLSIPVLLLTCSQDWTCNLQMIVFLESEGTNAYNRYAVSCWTFFYGCYEFYLELIPALIFLLLSAPCWNELGFLLLSLVELVWDLGICIGM